MRLFIIVLIFVFVFLANFYNFKVQAKEIENLVQNPDFEAGTAGWSISAPNTLMIDKKEKFPVGNVVKATIDVVGANDWEPEIHSQPFNVEINKMYTMSFWAKTEPEVTRTIGAKFEQLDTWVGPSTTFTLNDKMTEYSFSPMMTMSSPPGVVVHIQFNRQKEDVWFAHFRVYEGKYVPEDLEGKQKIAVAPKGKLAITWSNIKSK
ncbi:MAG: carbohydrate binding domain-containing protein [bacterium]